MEGVGSLKHLPLISCLAHTQAGNRLLCPSPLKQEEYYPVIKLILLILCPCQLTWSFTTCLMLACACQSLEYVLFSSYCVSPIYKCYIKEKPSTMSKKWHADSLSGRATCSMLHKETYRYNRDGVISPRELLCYDDWKWIIIMSIWVTTWVRILKLVDPNWQYKVCHFRPRKTEVFRWPSQTHFYFSVLYDIFLIVVLAILYIRIFSYRICTWGVLLISQCYWCWSHTSSRRRILFLKCFILRLCCLISQIWFLRIDLNWYWCHVCCRSGGSCCWDPVVPRSPRTLPESLLLHSMNVVHLH